MNIKNLFLAVALGTAVLAPATASAIDIKDLLGGAGGAVENIVEGIFTRSDISVKEMKGEWAAS